MNGVHWEKGRVLGGVNRSIKGSNYMSREYNSVCICMCAFVCVCGYATLTAPACARVCGLEVLT